MGDHGYHDEPYHSWSTRDVPKADETPTEEEKLQARGGVCAPLTPTFDLSFFDREPMTPEEHMALKRRIMEEAAKIKAEEEALAAAKQRVEGFIRHHKAHPEDGMNVAFVGMLQLVLDEANKVPDLEAKLYE